MSASNPRPLMTLQVGQAGVQIGHAVWELFCLEHNIRPDGTPKLHCGDLGNVETVFVPTPKGRYFPRSLFVDTDPLCIDEMRSGPYQHLFSPRQLLSDQSDSASNYTTGRYGYAKRLLPDTLERLRWMMEKADAKPTVCLMHSACGGTGSGFSAACLTKMSDELGIGSQSIIDLCVVPGTSARQSSCELLNTALYLDESQDLTRQTICVSNSALFRLCSSQLQSHGSATFAHVNRALATAFSNLTATERLPGSSASLMAILDSLLPFRHLRYPLLACAPFLTAETARTELPTAKTVTSAVLEVGSQYLDVDPRTGCHAAGFLLYRGGVSLTETQKLAAELTERKRVRFHNWAPSGFRTGVVIPPPVAPPRSGFSDAPISVTLLASHSGISNVFTKLATSAKRLQDRDLFVHSYEGAIVSLLNRQMDKSGLHRTPFQDSQPQQQPQPQPQPQQPPNNGSASAENTSVRRWMNPPAAHGAVNPEQQDQLRRRIPSKDPGFVQQQQRQPEDLQVSRTCALSDVFGVRIRLSSAIDYLQRVSQSYAEDSHVDAADDAEVDAAAVADDVIAKTTGDNGAAAGAKLSAEQPSVEDSDDEEPQQVSGVQDPDQVHATPKDVAGTAGSKNGSEADSSSRRVAATQQQETEHTEEQVEQSGPSAEQITSNAESASGTPVNNANLTGQSGEPQFQDAPAGPSSNRWCLRRRSKSRRPDEAAASNQANSTSGKHPAIAEAERILMKYNWNLGGQ